MYNILGALRQEWLLHDWVCGPGVRSRGLACVTGALLMQDIVLGGPTIRACYVCVWRPCLSRILGVPSISTGSVPCGFTKPTPLHVMLVTGVIAGVML